jgi:[ribosomal protein S5]-alanine N-acetyltransferase
LTARGESASLRAWRSNDAESMARHLNNPNIGRNMADWYPADGYTIELAREWVTTRHIAFGGMSWAIANAQDEAIGGAGIHPGAGFDRCNVEIGYWLSETVWGRGIGSALIAALTAQAFAIEGVTRVFAPIHARNLASQRVCEKNGFVCEGLRRMSVMKSGQAIDTVVWAMYLDVFDGRRAVK